MPALPVERTTATFTGNTLAARQMLIIGIHFQRDLRIFFFCNFFID
ncbi:hypothetical protein [Acetobacter indonesiensis]|nr:hypothetical protein [Acetobacter indonesiensis]MCP1229679.1 hypothetical protein [Acetobacter indonesiensis]